MTLLPIKYCAKYIVLASSLNNSISKIILSQFYKLTEFIEKDMKYIFIMYLFDVIDIHTLSCKVGQT
jgi:hypothetical protein